MFQPVARTRSGQRVFPPIASNLYEAAPDGTTSGDAACVLGLVRSSTATRLRRRGRRAQPTDPLARVLRDHSRALAAEVAGDPTRADFYWEETRRGLRTLAPDHEAWRALAKDVSDKHPGSPLAQPATLRLAIRAELIVDSHLACYNGAVQSGSTRAAVQREMLGHLLLTGAAEERAQMAPLADSEIAEATEAEDWGRCAKACEWILPLVAGAERYEYEQRCASFIYMDGVAATRSGAGVGWRSSSLEPEANDGRIRADLERIRAGRRKLERFRSDHPGTPAAINRLAELYQLQAVGEFRIGELSNALVSMERALLFRPDLEGGTSNREQLHQSMAALQERWRQVEQRISGTPNAQLTPDGIRLKREAALGTEPLQRFLASTEPAAIGADRDRARDRGLWMAMGLPVPDSDWTARARGLYEVALEALASPSGTLRRLTSLIESRLRDTAALEDLPSAPIAAYLHAKHRGEDPPAPPARAVLESGPAQLVPVPRTPLALLKRRPPLVAWLLSGQRKPVKVQLVAGLLISLLAFGMHSREGVRAEARARAYADLTTAYQSQDWARALSAARRFLATPIAAASDERESEVRRLSAEALVRHAVEDGPNTPAVVEQTRRYRELASGNPRQ